MSSAVRPATKQASAPIKAEATSVKTVAQPKGHSAESTLTKKANAAEKKDSGFCGWLKGILALIWACITCQWCCKKEKEDVAARTTTQKKPPVNPEGTRSSKVATPKEEPKPATAKPSTTLTGKRKISESHSKSESHSQVVHSETHTHKRARVVTGESLQASGAKPTIFTLTSVQSADGRVFAGAQTSQALPSILKAPEKRYATAEHPSILQASQPSSDTQAVQAVSLKDSAAETSRERMPDRKVETKFTKTVTVSHSKTVNGDAQELIIRIKSHERGVERQVGAFIEDFSKKLLLPPPEAQVEVLVGFITSYKNYDARVEALGRLTEWVMKRAGDSFNRAVDNYPTAKNPALLQMEFSTMITTIQRCALVSECCVGEAILTNPDSGIDFGTKKDWRKINKTARPVQQEVCKTGELLLKVCQEYFTIGLESVTQTEQLKQLEQLFTSKIARLHTASGIDIVKRL